MKNEKDILKRFIKLFDATRLTKSEFAKKINISHQSLNKYMNDENDLQKISLRLFKEGVSIDWLYSGNGESYIHKSKNPITITRIDEFDYSVQKKRIEEWIEEHYENLIEFEIERGFDRYEVQDIFKDDRQIPYLILKRIENAGCNIHWSITGEGSQFADNITGNKLREQQK